MSRIYGETIDRKIRNGTLIIVACLICFLCSCKKEEQPPICQTCTITTVTSIPSQPDITSIESQTEYCNHEYDTIKKGLIFSGSSSTNGGHTWTYVKKTRTCQ